MVRRSDQAEEGLERRKMKTNDEEMTNKELQIWIAGELKSFRAEGNGEWKALRIDREIQ